MPTKGRMRIVANVLQGPEGQKAEVIRSVNGLTQKEVEDGSIPITYAGRLPEYFSLSLDSRVVLTAGMRLFVCTLLISLMLPLGPRAATAGEHPYRTWTSTVGTSIEAQLVQRAADDSLSLRQRDGTTFRVKLDQLSAADQDYLQELAALEGRPGRILFIGNSYTGQIRGMLTQLVATSPYRDCQLDFIHPGGRTLEQHLASEATMQKIREGKWDVVVLQDQSQTPAIFPDKFMQAAREIDRIIDAAEARTVFYETWGRRDGDKMNAQRFPTYEKMQQALSDAYARAARKYNAELAPVGQAWAWLRQQHPAIGSILYHGDGSHPAAAGAYLAACVLYVTLFDADPTKVNFNGGLPEDQVNAIHAAVRKILQ